MNLASGRGVLALVLACLAAPAPADAADAANAEEATLPGDFSATVAFATDYVNRGISQTSEDIALQSSVDWNHTTGVYAGIWGSNVDFKDGSTHLEIDVYGGYAGRHEGISYDAMILGYLYPGADRDLNRDFVEFSLTLGYDLGLASASTEVAVSPDFYGSRGVGTHVGVGVGIPVPLDLLARYGVALDGAMGYQDIADGGSYIHWNAGIGGAAFGFDLDLRYVGTDINQTAVDGDRVIFTLSRSF